MTKLIVAFRNFANAPKTKINRRKTNFQKKKKEEEEEDLSWDPFVHRKPTWITLGLNPGEAGD